MSKETKFIIKSISSRDTFPVRHPVLREGRPIEDCVFTDDDLETTIHLGLFIESKVVAVATFLQSDFSLFSEKNQYQLRGMAVLKTHQGFGYGDALLKQGEYRLKLKNVPLIWFNAREIAVGFYKKNAYQIIGDSFEISGVGTHYVMYKTL